MDAFLPSTEKRAAARLNIVELFKITCVTCQAGLSVRNESIIGKIVACPQCGSMVQVVAPGEAELSPAEAGSPGAVDELSVPEPPVEDSVASDLPTVAAVASYRWIAWAIGILVVGTTLLGTALFWSSEPEISEAAPLPAIEQPDTTEIEESSVPETVAIDSTVVTPIEEETAAELPPVELDVRSEETIVEATVEDAKPQAVVEPVEVARVARRFDPLDLDPEGLDLNSLDHLGESDTVAAPVGPPATGETGTNPKPESSTFPIVRRGSDPERDVAATDAKQQLARRLPILEVRAMRLVDFLTLVSQLSGSPVSVGSEQLLMAGISPRKQVSLAASDISLDEALTRVLEPLRLEHVVDGPQVILLRKDSDQVREIDYPIDDLVSDDTDAEQLANWLRQLVAPTSWQGAPLEFADQSFRIQQSQRVHYQVLVFLERMRLVRGLSTRSSYPVERFAPTPLHAAMAERLTAPALFTFSRETPLSEVFLHWQRELDLPLLVDWPALAELQLWPESTVICAVADRPWHDVLTDVLEPLGLDWRATIGGAIEISSAEQFARDLQLELYPLISDKPTDADQILQGLRDHFSQNRLAALEASDTELVFDPTAPAILALQPATAQREILAWLVEQGLFRQP